VSPVELALSEKVRNPQRPEVTLQAALPDGALIQLDDEEVLETLAVVARVIRSLDLEQVARHAVVLLIVDPVGLDEPTQFDEQVAGDGMVATEALGLADEAEQPLRVTSRKD
jgi:hypothetical protein